MVKKRGFTLIELLVVIAILGLLLAILLPALSESKKQAGSVICKTNLVQWGMCYELYTQENDGKFPLFISGDWENSTFMESYRGYYDNLDQIRLCPAAKRYIPGANPINSDKEFGTTFSTWWMNSAAVGFMNDEDIGISSYGENSWVRSGTDLSVDKLWISKTYLASPWKIPLLADARWCNAIPEDTHPLPVPVSDEIQFYYLAVWRHVQCFAMNRHKNGINVSFADGSTRWIPAEELWSLRWNRTYLPRNNVDLRWMKNF